MTARRRADAGTAAAEIDFAELGEQLAGLLDRHAAAREKSG